MPTTRRQAAVLQGKTKSSEAQDSPKKTTQTSRKAPRPQTQKRKAQEEETSPSHLADDQNESQKTGDEAKFVLPPAKKAKVQGDHVYKTGTIERGHIFFFYRPRVEREDVQSLDDIRNFHMLLIPRPPEFSVAPSGSPMDDNKAKISDAEGDQMNVLQPGADTVPASDDTASTKKHYRLITVGKKRLPDPESSGGSGHKKETFWATVTAVGDDLSELAQSFEGKTYETKTRGTRHEGPVRLVARGGYAIVNSDAKTPSQRETHLGYHVSHPPPADLGEVQTSLGVFSASSFVVQVKNPLAPANSSQQAHSKPAEYPDWIMCDIFGTSEEPGEAPSRGRESYGLRFTSCETPELLDHKGAQLLFIAAREGEEGLEMSLGKGRGNALAEKEEEEAREEIQQVFTEIGLNFEKFPVESLQGSWV